MKKFVFLTVLAALISGCQTTSVDPDPSILRVGVSPRSQPMVFKENDQLMGIEVEFARKLGASLNREVVFVETPWNKLIDNLEQNKIDIIMSNMSITDTRKMRINFASPYLQSGLTALFARGQADPGGLIPSTIRHRNGRIGYVENTTSEFYCIRRFTQANLRAYKNADAGIKAVLNGRLDMFIHDAPVIWWRAARHESELVVFQEALVLEPIAWGIGKHNPALLEKVNALITAWEKDGSTQKTLQNWIPTFGM